MLENPSPDDWLMYSRTYDAQRYSPLKQISRQTVMNIRQAWTDEVGNGTIEHSARLPRRDLCGRSGRQRAGGRRDDRRDDMGTSASGPRTKTLAIFEDLLFYTAPDGFIVALDTETGKMRWETKSTGGLTSGPIVVEGKVLTGRTCAGRRENCYVSAHDARTGKEVWRFYTAAGDDDPGGKTWGNAPEATRSTATWGLPGSYDPVRRLIYWGVANPTPNTRAVHHGGDPDAIPTFAPADLYSNSTVA